MRAASPWRTLGIRSCGTFCSLYDPFGVDVPFKCDTTTTTTINVNQCLPLYQVRFDWRERLAMAVVVWRSTTRVSGELSAMIGGTTEMPRKSLTESCFKEAQQN